MQQFFCDEILNENDLIDLNKDVLYQLKKVLRVENGYKFRLVDVNHICFECEYQNEKCKVINKIDEYNELDIDITVILALIKNDKFDFAIQKLTELGVKRIVPYKAYRSVVKEGKGTNKLDRFKKIVREASEQSHRNLIPEVCDYISINEIEKYKSDINLLAYEKEDIIDKNFSDGKSITLIIGPEGGFEKTEVDKILSMGFKSISLGKRILRAETAAIYLTSVIVGENQ